MLLEKTWEALRITNAPKVTVDCMVADLYRLGYNDVPIRLHDTALVDITPIGAQLQLEVIQLNVDLLDPTATRPVIGAYIPNIVYINRETASRAGGGGGGGRGGGGRGQTNAELQRSEFETEITANQYQISLRAYQVDMTNVETILQESGVAISAGGTIIYANNNLNNMKSDISVNAGNIALVVTNGALDAGKITLAINNGGSRATIDADQILLNGSTKISSLLTGAALISALSVNSLSTQYLGVRGEAATMHTVTLMSSDGVTPVTIRYLGA